MLSALIYLAASFELRWFLLPSGSRRCSAHPGWAFPTARVFLDLFNSWIGVRAGGIKSKVWGCCLPPGGHLVGRKGVRRSWFGGRSGVRNVPVACVDCVNGSPCRIGTIC